MTTLVNLFSNLLDKKTSLGRAFRTFYQTFSSGLISFLIIFPLIKELPEFKSLIEQYPQLIGVVTILSLVASIISLWQNKIGK